MKESVNNVDIEGIVSEVNLREIEKGDKKYVAGEVVVMVVDKNGVTNMIPVGFISADKKKDGTENKNYARLMQLKDFNSIASAGLEAATKVQIRGAKLQENLFLPQNGDTVISTLRINSNFFTKVNDTNYNPNNSFTLTGSILAMTAETRTNADGEAEETGRLIVQMACVGYADKVEVFKLIVENQAHIDFVQANWKVGDTVRVGGMIKFTEENVEREVEVGFGDAETRSYTRRVRELIITRGSAGPLDEEESYSEEDIKAGLAARKQRMAELQSKPEVKPAAQGATKFTDADF